MASMFDDIWKVDKEWKRALQRLQGVHPRYIGELTINGDENDTPLLSIIQPNMTHEQRIEWAERFIAEEEPDAQD